VDGSASRYQFQWLHNGVEVPGAVHQQLVLSAVDAAAVGDYVCHVSNAGGEVFSSPARVTLGSGPPRIVRDVASVSDVPFGGPASLHVEGACFPNRAYQRARSQHKRLAHGARVQVYYPPSPPPPPPSPLPSPSHPHPLLLFPAAVAAIDTCAPVLPPRGGPAAVGNPAPSFQWYKDGVAIQFATAPVLTIPHVQEADEGMYVCRVSNAEGFVDSGSASLQYARSAPVITNHPAAITASLGDTVTLSVQGAREAGTRSVCALLPVPAPLCVWALLLGERGLGACGAVLVACSHGVPSPQLPVVQERAPREGRDAARAGAGGCD
jgi:hypothetical protein